MNNNSDHISSNKNDIPTINFIQSPLDMDDDEFRAGYPFTSISLKEINEQNKPWCAQSLASDNSAFESAYSKNNDFNKTTKEDDESNRILFREYDKLVKLNLNSSKILDDNNDCNGNINQNEDHYNIVQTDNDKQINQPAPHVPYGDGDDDDDEYYDSKDDYNGSDNYNDYDFADDIVYENKLEATISSLHNIDIGWVNISNNNY
ncbi:unnamed protein product [Rotaria sordida]|uniref:Uncharacterized protein n=1 Tax=Rotaria sordida TaxID=392033 RepID=A0A815KYD1_9BILA|nr:unnamed protein product [Rotaria sordida]